MERALKPPRWHRPPAELGGRIKVEPEDFVVEELPAHAPSGRGEHLYLWVEKTGIPTDAMVRHIAAATGIEVSAIGTAGLKDKRAVTRQSVSVPASVAGRVGEIDGDAVRVLRTERHGQKLRTGHLAGNRFQLRVRGVGLRDPAALAELVATVRERGFPNYYGPQRFGDRGRSVERGLAILRGARAKRGRLLRLLLNSVQSALFNQYLAARIDDGVLDRVLSGELMQVVKTGLPFAVGPTELEREQARLDAHETVATGPMFGPKMRAPRSEAGAREGVILAGANLSVEDFERFGKLAAGTRRANLVWVDDLSARLDGADARLEFTLPPGSYATVLLAELGVDVNDPGSA